MKGTFFSSDFVKDANGDLRLIEVNTDTAVVDSEVSNFDLSGFISVLDSNNIGNLTIVYKPTIQANIVNFISSSVSQNAATVTAIELIKEDINTVYPTFVMDDSTKFILRLAYDEGAILDSYYAKNRLNVFNLFTDSGINDYTVGYYHSSSAGIVDTLSRDISPSNIPDAAIKDVDETFNPIDFFKIGSQVEGESDADRWNAFVNENKAADKIIEQYHFHSSSIDDEGKITSIRHFGIVYGNSLEVINLHSYAVSAIFDLPTSLDTEVQANVYSNKLNDYHYYEYTTNFPKGGSDGVLSSHKIHLPGNNFKTLADLVVGDEISSYFISGSPDESIDVFKDGWSYEGSSFPVGSYLTSSLVVFKEEKDLKYNGLVELKVDNDSFYVGVNKQFLIYNSESNQTTYTLSQLINPDKHYFYDFSGSLIDIDEANFYATTDNGLKFIELDVEDTDTYLISGSTTFNSIISHNAPCFVAGTLISMYGGGFKNVEHVQVNDTVLSYNFKSGKVEPQKVKGIGSKEVKQTVIYTFKDNTTLRCTIDHPLFSKEEGWVSKSPDYTFSKYGLVTKEPSAGVKIQKQDGSEVEITGIEINNNPITVYNVNVVEYNHNFFANEFLVHNRSCFITGTKVSKELDLQVNIEEIQLGDEVLSFNEVTRELEKKRVVDISTPIHNDMVKVTLASGNEIVSTKDHPYYTFDLGIVSANPELTKQRYGLENVSLLTTSTILRGVDGEELKIANIQNNSDASVQTYIITVEDNHNFFANGILVHNK